MLKVKKGSCFFCLKRKATLLLCPVPPLKWPAPIPPDEPIQMCRRCARSLSAGQIAKVVADHANNLRRQHNRNVQAAQDRAHLN